MFFLITPVGEFKKQKSRHIQEMSVAVEFESIPLIKVQPIKLPSQIDNHQIKKDKPISKKINGSFPPVSANYRKYVGFKRYADFMIKEGALFLISDIASNRLLKIDFAAGSLKSIKLRDLKRRNFSPKTRIINDEPYLKSFITKAKNEYGVTTPEILLLLPCSIEEKIAFKTIAYFKERNASISNVSSLKGDYRISDNKLKLTLSEAVYNRKEKTIQIIITF